MESTPQWTSYKSIIGFYDRVRSVLFGASSTLVSDAMIDLYENAPYAETVIKSRVPLWDELDAEKMKIFESCIVYQTAVRLRRLVRTKARKSEKSPTLQIEFVSRAADAADNISFESIIDSMINQINGTTGSSFVGFRVTGGSIGGPKI